MSPILVSPTLYLEKGVRIQALFEKNGLEVCYLKREFLSEPIIFY